MALGCQWLTQRSTGSGLSETHCKQHVEFHRRHGSYWHKSYSAAQLAPYRRATQRWLRSRSNDQHVQRVIGALDALLADSGPSESARVRLDPRACLVPRLPAP
jgi:hypothetical protein